MTDWDLGKVIGDNGEDAPQIESIEKTSTSGLVDTYTITLDDGSEYTFEVTNGEDGSTVSVSQVLSSGTKIATITIDGTSTDLFSPSGGGSADIVTAWEQVLSDLKVPSEKLVKTTLDTKISKSNTTGLVKNDGTIDTTSYVSDVSGKEDSSNKVTSWSSTTSDTHYPSEKLTKDSLDGKQATLVSGTNIATINNQSLLNGGNITITGVDIGTFSDLQDLIDDASSGDTIILDKDYKYDSTTDSSLTTGIEINNDLTIIGNGHIIDGNNTSRAFYINGQYTFNLSDVRIQNCKNSNDGGAIKIANNSTVTIHNSIFHNNMGNSCNGGAIYSDTSTLILNNVLFTKNSAKNSTRAVINNEGGAIYTYSGELVLHSCSFNENTASNYGDIYCQSTVTTSYDCIIPNIATSCYNVSNITTKSLYDSIEGVEEDMLL